jgi:uncharacterized lipoprotein YddW (UPF0748 family)
LIPLRFIQPFVGITLMVLLSAVCQKTHGQPLPYKQEVRGVWITNVDSDVLSSREKIAEAMDYLASRGFNVVFPVVWNKGYTLYPSRTMRREFGTQLDQYNLSDLPFKSQNRDPLRELIVEAHRNGMEVIPWFEFGFSSSYSQNGGHLINNRPHWKAIDINGKLVVKNGFDWMDALNPEVQNFMLNLIREVIEDYDVDGVQGDDRLPAMPAEGGYSDQNIEMYRAEHNGQNPPAQFNNAAFMKWKADKLTNFGGRLYRMVKQHDPKLIVSMSPSIFPFSYSQYLQDWPRWMDSSYVDLLHPQAYRYDINSYRNLIIELVGSGTGSSGYVKPVDRAKLSPGILIKAGNQFNRSTYIRQAVEFNRSRGINGEVFFFYEGLRDKNEFAADTLYKYFYNVPALLPFRDGKIRRPKAIIVDENTPGAVTTGTWTSTIEYKGHNGGVLRTPEGSASSIEWSTKVPWTAWYDVYVFNPVSNFESSQAASYSTWGDLGRKDTLINQRSAGRGWIKIGTQFITAGNRKFAELRSGSINNGRHIFADGAMLILNRKLSPDIVLDGMLLSNTQTTPPNVPVGPILHQNYPNPFNPTTTITFSLPQRDSISLDVLDISGKVARSMVVNSTYQAGTHSMLFDGSMLASGVYIIRLQTSAGTVTQKLTLLK